MNGDQRNTHTLAIVALVIAYVSLVLSLIVAGSMVFKSGSERAIDTALPKHLSEKQLADIAQSIADRFNADDFDELYARFDPAARVQMSADTLKKQVRPSPAGSESPHLEHCQCISCNTPLDFPAVNTRAVIRV